MKENMSSKNYEIVITKSASKELHGFSSAVVQRIVPAIRSLSIEPRPNGCKKLKDSNNRYRIRVGDYRILYLVEDKIKIIEIVGIKNRKEAYE